MSSSPRQRAAATKPPAGTTDAAVVPAPPSSAGPKARLGHYRDVLPGIFGRAVDAAVAAGFTKTALCEEAGIQRTHLLEMIDGLRRIDPAHLFALPAPARLVLAEALAGPDYLLVPVPRADGMEDAWETLDDTQLAASHAVHEAVKSFRDGHVTRDEGARLDEAADRVMRAAGALRALARRAMESGVQGVPRAVRGVG